MKNQSIQCNDAVSSQKELLKKINKVKIVQKKILNNQKESREV